MAKKVVAPKKRAGPKAKPAKAEKGHNSVVKVDRAKTKDFFEKLDKLHKDKADDASSFASKIGHLYEQAANTLGTTQKAIKRAYKRHKFEKTWQAEEKELDAQIANETDALVLAAASYSTTPLGLAAQERSERTAAAKEMGAAEEKKDEEQS